MRAEGGEGGVDCNDSLTKLACELDSEDCPAACKNNREEDNTDTIVKSGDLAVTVTPATEKKAILDGGVSDLDTVTLKASEPITVNSITLERFGYSTAADIDAIWLEDGEGNKIADEKSLSSSKDTVTLKIKKEYREMDASNALTIVLRTAKFEQDVAATDGYCTVDDEVDENITTAEACEDANVADDPDTIDVDETVVAEWTPGTEGKEATYTAAKAGSTIGFKVVEIDASAKNLDLANYSPYTYDLVKYGGSQVVVTPKGDNKEYNYEEGKFFEVSRVRVEAGTAAISLRGLTLTNKKDETAVLDLDEVVANVKVTADGKEVSGLKYNVTKDNELVLSFDEIEIAINKKVQLIVSVALENVDEFGSAIRLVLDESGDLNATEKKTGARVTVSVPETATWKEYIFNGSKIKFSNTKLSSTIDAAQGSTDVVIAKGSVTVSEEVKLSELVFTANKANIIEDMTLTIGGEDYDASISTDKTQFTFKNVFIEKSGDVELSVDIVDEEDANGEEVTIYYGADKVSIGKTIFNTDNGRYETSREYVDPDDVAGSISISKVKVQESKGSFTNKQTTKKNVVINETKDVEVFDGTYTAKKGTVLLDNVKIVKVAGEADGADISFKVTIDGEDVADIDNPGENGDDVDFDPIEIAAGKSVNIKVVATAYAEAETAAGNEFEYKITVSGKDDKGNDAGSATKAMAKIAFVPADKITVSSSSSAKKQDVILASDNQVISWFVVEPEKKAASATIDDVVFGIEAFRDVLEELNNDETDPDEWSDPDSFFEFAIGDDTADDMSFDVDDAGNLILVISDMGAEISKAADAKLTFLETLTSPIDGEGTPYVTTLDSVNGNPQTDKEFSRLVVNSLVRVASQEASSGETEYTFEIDYSDDAQTQTIESITFTFDTPDESGSNEAEFTDVTEGKNGYTAKNIDASARYVMTISWENGDGEEITVNYEGDPKYPDFFKVDGKRVQAFKD